MKKLIEETIIHLAEKSTESTDANDALKFTQALLNATNALVCLKLNYNK